MDDDEKPLDPSEIVRSSLSNAVTGGLPGAANGDPAAMLLGMGIGAVNGALTPIIEKAVGALTTGDERLKKLQDTLAAKALVDAAPKIAPKLEALREKVGADEAVASVFPITKVWAQTWTRAEGKKRRVIMAALVSAFDPESYEAAMSERFFGLVDELDYPEIYYLVQLVRSARKTKSQSAPWGIVYSDEAIPGDAEMMRRERLIGLKLLGAGGTSYRNWTITWLGFEFVAFLERGGISETIKNE